jgi:hypothetical protein
MQGVYALHLNLVPEAGDANKSLDPVNTQSQRIKLAVATSYPYDPLRGKHSLFPSGCLLFLFGYFLRPPTSLAQTRVLYYFFTPTLFIERQSHGQLSLSTCGGSTGMRCHVSKQDAICANPGSTPMFVRDRGISSASTTSSEYDGSSAAPYQDIQRMMNSWILNL